MLDRLVTGTHQNRSFSSDWSSLPLGRRGQPDEVVNMIMFLLSDRASFMTGMVAPIDGGMTA